MEWLELIVEWVALPLIIIYGFTSWAKDNPDKSIFGSLGKNPKNSENKKTPRQWVKNH